MWALIPDSLKFMMLRPASGFLYAKRGAANGLGSPSHIHADSVLSYFFSGSRPARSWVIIFRWIWLVPPKI